MIVEFEAKENIKEIVRREEIKNEMGGQDRREPDDERKEKEMENGGKDEEGETERKEGDIDKKEDVGGGSGIVVGREAGGVGVQGGFRCEKQQKCRRKVKREGERGVGRSKGERRKEGEK